MKKEIRPFHRGTEKEIKAFRAALKALPDTRHVQKHGFEGAQKFYTALRALIVESCLDRYSMAAAGCTITMDCNARAAMRPGGLKKFYTAKAEGQKSKRQALGNTKKVKKVERVGKTLKGLSAEQIDAVRTSKREYMRAWWARKRLKDNQESGSGVAAAKAATSKVSKPSGGVAVRASKCLEELYEARKVIETKIQLLEYVLQGTGNSDAEAFDPDKKFVEDNPHPTDKLIRLA